VGVRFGLYILWSCSSNFGHCMTRFGEFKLLTMDRFQLRGRDQEDILHELR
jgi:hypothetical protein